MNVTHPFPDIDKVIFYFAAFAQNMANIQCKTEFWTGMRKELFKFLNIVYCVARSNLDADGNVL